MPLGVAVFYRCLKWNADPHKETNCLELAGAGPTGVAQGSGLALPVAAVLGEVRYKPAGSGLAAVTEWGQGGSRSLSCHQSSLDSADMYMVLLKLFDVPLDTVLDLKR